MDITYVEEWEEKVGEIFEWKKPQCWYYSRVGSSSMLNLDGFYYGPHRTAPVYRSIPLVNLRYHYIRSKCFPYKASYEIK